MPTALALFTQTGAAHAQEPGDLNRDGSLNVADGVFALQSLVSPPPAPEHSRLRLYGDLNADGSFDVADVVLLLRVAVRLRPNFLNETRPLPPLKGKLAYQMDPLAGVHNGMLILYDFATNQISNISDAWNLTVPRNPHFSRDGSKIVFSAIQNGSPHRDIFVWTIGNHEGPLNLTGGNDSTEEDPRFSPIDDSIVYKQWDPQKERAQIGVLDPNGKVLGPLPMPQTDEELSMPFYLHDGRTLLFVEGKGEKDPAVSNIYLSDTSTCMTNLCSKKPLANEINNPEYYPIPWTLNRFLNVRWLDTDPSPQPDQIYMSVGDTPLPYRLPFNMTNVENADPFPVDDRMVIFSSNRAGSKSYDLYLGDAVTGQVWPLSGYRLDLQNDSDEIGAAYFNPAAAPSGSSTD